MGDAGADKDRAVMSDTDPPVTDEPDPDAPPDAADPALPKRIRNRQRREMVEAERFWAAVFKDRVGRAEMWKVLAQCHPFEDRFANGPTGVPQESATDFQAGQKSIGMALFRSWLRMVPDGVLTMLGEHDPDFVTAKKTKRIP